MGFPQHSRNILIFFLISGGRDAVIYREGVIFKYNGMRRPGSGRSDLDVANHGQPPLSQVAVSKNELGCDS